MSKIGKEILRGLDEFVESLKKNELLHLMKYKNYYGTVHYSDEDLVFYGKIAFIRSLISYEGTDVKSLHKAFAEAVDDYLLLCKKTGKRPEYPFHGKFRLRMINVFPKLFSAKGRSFSQPRATPWEAGFREIYSAQRANRSRRIVGPLGR